MIKTTELMLGNLIEFGGDYMVVTALNNEKITCGTVCERVEHFNPIPLTDVVLKRLDVTATWYKYVHQLQNNRTINSCPTIDITPLLSPRYTTHDGVEVWEGDEVWYTFMIPHTSDTPEKWIVGVDMDNTRYLHFSTKEKAQSYIDSLTRKPIFTTEDGVDVFEGDKYWFVGKNGMTPGKDKDIPHWTYCTEGSGNLSAKYAYFSTEQLAQAYLNKVWAEAEYNNLIGKK